MANRTPSKLSPLNQARLKAIKDGIYKAHDFGLVSQSRQSEWERFAEAQARNILQGIMALEEEY